MRLTGAVSALADRRLLLCAAALAPDVRHEGDRLLDDHTGGSVRLNPTAAAVVESFGHGAPVAGVVSAAVQRFPGTPVRTDVLRLVRDLNAAGLVDVWPWQGRSAAAAAVVGFAPWCAPLVRCAEGAVRWVLAASSTRRRRVPWPRGAVSLAASVISCLTPLLLIGAAGAVAYAATEPRHVVDILCGTAALVVSVVAHELGHAVVLGGRRVTYVRSLGGVRVLVGRCHADRRWWAAVAGPLAGAGVAALTVVAAEATRRGADVGAGLVIGVSHLLSLSPWAADGRLLRAPSGATSAPDTVRT